MATSIGMGLYNPISTYACKHMGNMNNCTKCSKDPQSNLRNAQLQALQGQTMYYANLSGQQISAGQLMSGTGTITVSGTTTKVTTAQNIKPNNWFSGLLSGISGV